MKMKVFEAASHLVANPPEALGQKINDFLAEHPTIDIRSTQFTSAVLPAEGGAMRNSQAGQPALLLFATIFYTE